MDQYSLWAELDSFTVKESKTLSLISNSLTKFQEIGVSFSGGKDSLVMLHMISRCFDKFHVAFFDSGAEYPDTLECINQAEKDFNLDLTIVQPAWSIIKLRKMAGNFGYCGPEFNGTIFKQGDLKRILVTEPAETFRREYGIQVQCIGLRMEESRSRSALLKNGALQRTEYSGIYHFYPLRSWTGKDIWAYISKYGLRFNTIYDKLKFCNENREIQRVGSYFGATNLSRGRFLFLRTYYPEIFFKLISEFPGLKAYV